MAKHYTRVSSSDTSAPVGNGNRVQYLHIHRTVWNDRSSDFGCSASTARLVVACCSCTPTEKGHHTNWTHSCAEPVEAHTHALFLPADAAAYLDLLLGSCFAWACANTSPDQITVVQVQWFIVLCIFWTWLLWSCNAGSSFLVYNYRDLGSVRLSLSAKISQLWNNIFLSQQTSISIS
jgi:hypothetical protein